MDIFFVYILISKNDQRTYVGYAKDLQKRLTAHYEGRVLATKNRRPLELLHHESFSDMKIAKQREKWWKSGAGRRRLKQFFSTLSVFQ